MAKMLVAIPRSDAGNMSAITPPALVRGDEPRAPAKNRKTIRAAMVGAPAAPALNAVRAM